MNVLFIGLGSIAIRHIKNLQDLLGGEVSVTVLRSGMGRDVPSELSDSIRCVYSHEELADHYDAVFITNPTAKHYDTLQKFLNISDAFFVEKPVFLTGEEDISSFKECGKLIYVASPMRYTNVVQYLKANINFDDVYSMRCISSSYLPKWRETDYRKSYSARKDLGGGVSIDLIHEWDYISFLIGFPQSVKSIITRKSDLEIDSDDIAIYVADYEDKTVELHLDYFGRKTMRQVELFTKNDTIQADLVNQRIKWLCSGKELDLTEDRNSYQKKELQHFLDMMNGKIPNDNTVEHACRTLKIARGY